MDKEKNILANWTPDKETSPYDYGSEYPKYDYTPFSFKILSHEEADRMFRTELTDEKSEGKIYIFLDLWDLHLIDNPRASEVIRPVGFQDVNGGENFNYFELFETFDNLFNEEQPLKVYAKYPFQKIVEQTINPIKLTTYYAEIETNEILPIGYIAWQIGKLYSELYKDHHEKVGISGHSLSDLQLGTLEIYENNKITITVNS